MKPWFLLLLLPLIASAQSDDTFSQMQQPGGHTLYCATSSRGFQSCIQDEPNWWDSLKTQQTPQAVADPPVATFAFNTSESHTGGGGALELGLLLSVMGIRRATSRKPSSSQ